jgi:hypothetical protein
MLTTEQYALDLTALAQEIAGRVVTPADPDWDSARAAWNLAVDQRPAAVAIPATADDVVAIVDAARRRGLKVAPQGTGHNAAALADLSDTIIVRTSEMRGVQLDVEGRRARVEAGALWGDLAGLASKAGLAPLAGSSHDVGIVGYTLGGGLSWLARRHGLSADNVLAIELVTADGRHVRTDAEHKAELFWALRGGGGNFGVVTAMELRLFEVSELYAGMLLFDWERAGEVLQAWREWTATVPDEVTSIGHVVQFPPLPEIPEPLRGRSVVTIEAAYLGTEASGAELLRPLRELGPEMDTFAMVPPATLLALHMDPPGPVPAMGDHAMLGELTAEAVDAFVAAVGPGSGSPLITAELRHLGGALARRADDGGALGTIDGAYAFFGAGVVVDEASAGAVAGQLGRAKSALGPWVAGREYLNFVEHPADTSESYDPADYAVLREIRAQVDPEELFRANHPIPPPR